MSGAAMPAVAAGAPALVLRRIGLYVFLAVVTAFFALPLLWLITAPLAAHPGYSVRWPQHVTSANFGTLYHDPQAVPSLWNAVWLAAGTMIFTVAAAALAAYALSRVRLPGRDALLYALLLLSSVITGTAAMVPIFQLMFDLHLIDNRIGLMLVLTGGLLPAAIFILKDFMDGTPASYEESARVFGAGPVRILWQIVVPVVRPGLATIAVWAVVNVWGNFLMPYLLLQDPAKQPAAVTLNSFYTQSGQPDLGLIAAFSLVYSIPVVLLYVFVQKRYGFRFYGGIKS